MFDPTPTPAPSANPYPTPNQGDQGFWLMFDPDEDDVEDDEGWDSGEEVTLTLP